MVPTDLDETGRPMTDPTDVPAASQTYGVELEAPDRQRRLLSLLAWPLRVIGAGLGIVDEPSFGDVVVRRLDDGSEVLRLPVTGTEETAIGLDEIQQQLDGLSASEFQARWGLER